MNPIIIRPLAAGDSVALYNIIEKNRVRLLNYFPKTSASITDLQTSKKYIQQKAKQALNREQYFFVVQMQEEPGIIGGVILKNIDWTIPKGELAYFIGAGYEGKGITTSAVGWLVKHAFDTLHFQKLYIKFNPENQGSKKVAIKNGFEKEGFLKSEFRTGYGELTDVERYGLVRTSST